MHRRYRLGVLSSIGGLDNFISRGEAVTSASSSQEGRKWDSRIKTRREPTIPHDM